jgi:hypothetical protein
VPERPKLLGAPALAYSSASYAPAVGLCSDVSLGPGPLPLL